MRSVSVSEKRRLAEELIGEDVFASRSTAYAKMDIEAIEESNTWSG